MYGLMSLPNWSDQRDQGVMESWEYAGHVSVNNMTQHKIFSHAPAHISAVLGQTREMEVSMESYDNIPHVWAVSRL